MKSLKKNLNKVALAIFLFTFPVVSFATCDDKTGICNPLKNPETNTIQGFIQVILQGAIKIGIPIVAVAIVYCGFLFVEARGNSEKLTKAKDALLYTLIGAAVLLGSWALAQLINNTVTSISY